MEPPLFSSAITVLSGRLQEGFPRGLTLAPWGRKEYAQVQREGQLLDAIGAELANNPEARRALGDALTRAIRNAPYDDPYLRGYTFGRFGTGAALAPFGISAMIGDGLHQFEHGVESSDEMLTRGLYGK